MSDATYRIEIEHLPGETFTFYARVYQVSSAGMPDYTCHSDDRDDALTMCQNWILSQVRKMETWTVYADDDGNIVPGHSVKA